MLIVFVKRFHSHLAHSSLDQFTDAIVHHRSGDTRLQAEAIRKIGCDVVLPTGNMDIERLRLAKGNDPGIQTMHQRAERKKVKFAIIFANS